MATSGRTAIAATTLLAVVLAACTALPPGGTRPPTDIPTRPSPQVSPPRQPTGPPTPKGAISIPLCDDVPHLSAPAEDYRESPIYVANEMPTDDVRAWAMTKPGFEEIWIDRERNGWITLAFSQDSQARQAELEREFPGVGVVAVAVDWTIAELEDVQRRVVETFRDRGLGGTGIYVNKGVVSIDLDVLRPELVADAEALFAGEPVCLSGLDPADAPAEGPQPQSGDGWRLLADEDETGAPYRTGIAYDDGSLRSLWAEARLQTEIPIIDFQSEVVIWFGTVHGSSCPRMRLDDVVVDRERALVYSEITYLDIGVCTADAIGHAYVVALERDRLPNGPFAIQLQSDDPPPGVVNEERMIVEVDLSAPGSVASSGDVHPDRSEPEPYYVMPGDFVEDGYPTDYRQSAHCGLEWLGPLNDVNWRTSETNGTDWIPAQWQDAIVDGEVRLKVLVTVDPPRLKATANGHSVIYEATADEPPGCD